MPDKNTVKRAKSKLRRGNSPTTAAGEFVKEEIEHIRHGEHGARSTQQAIAIGLSKARRAGIPLAPPAKRTGRDSTRKQAKRDLEAGKHTHKPDPRRSRASKQALKKAPHRAASHAALSKHAKQTARRRKRTTSR
jgi:hypothetical protein